MDIVDINTLSDLHEFFHYDKPLHPLLSVVDLAKVDRSHRKPGVSYRLAMYSIACKQLEGHFAYGRTTYDFSEGTLMFTAPHQLVSPGIENKVEGWGIYIHPDFLHASRQGVSLTDYSFFGYDAREALHISDAEKRVLDECRQNIQREISLNLDQHSYKLILTNLELLLSYCARFYDRQFLTRLQASQDVVEKFDRLLTDYFSQPSRMESGLPNVASFAAQLNLSPNYLSDLLHKHTGKSTLEYIHLKVVDKAKALLWSTEKPIREIAYELGFEHPSHFTKVFKNKTGLAPKQFRHQH